MGLAIVKHFVELHRGAIRIQSQAGQGTCVTLWLPGTQTDERLEETTNEYCVMDKILIIEDDQPLRSQIAKILRFEGLKWPKRRMEDGRGQCH